jgi:hypothetical protein
MYGGVLLNIDCMYNVHCIYRTSMNPPPTLSNLNIPWSKCAIAGGAGAGARGAGEGAGGAGAGGSGSAGKVSRES